MKDIKSDNNTRTFNFTNSEDESLESSDDDDDEASIQEDDDYHEEPLNSEDLAMMSGSPVSSKDEDFELKSYSEMLSETIETEHSDSECDSTSSANIEDFKREIDDLM